MNLGTPKIPDDYSQRPHGYEWIPFGTAGRVGYEYNTFPQQLASLLKESPTHNTIVDSKTSYILGRGIQVEDNNDSFQDYISDINGKGQHLDDVLYYFVKDWIFSGNGYLELIETEGGRAVYHVPATDVRYKALEQGERYPSRVFVHPDWRRANWKRNLLKEYPIYPQFEEIDGEMRSILCLKSYMPDFRFYGLPGYLGAMQYIKMEYLIGKYNNNRFYNGFQPSAIIQMFGSALDKDQRRKLSAQIKNELANSELDNNSKLFVLFNDDVDQATQVDIIPDNQEGSFLDLEELCTNNIVTAHQWYRSLAGLKTAGQLGNNQQIRLEYEIAMRTIEREQMKVKKVVKTILEGSPFEGADVVIKNEPPISKATEIDPTTVMTIQEQRVEIGLEEEYEGELLNNGNNDQTNNSRSGN